MKLLRWLGAGLLWILAGVVGLLGGVLSLTIVLLPIGIPLLMLARKLGTSAGKLLLPKALRHPGKELGNKSDEAASAVGKGARRFWGGSRRTVTDSVPQGSKKLGRKASKRFGRRKGLARLRWS